MGTGKPGKLVSNSVYPFHVWGNLNTVIKEKSSSFIHAQPKVNVASYEIPDWEVILAILLLIWINKFGYYMKRNI